MIKREHDTVELGDQQVRLSVSWMRCGAYATRAHRGAHSLIPFEQGSLDVPSFVLEDDHLFKHFYRDNLYNKCQNFIGYSEELGHVIISVEETKLDKAKVLIRHKKVHNTPPPFSSCPFPLSISELVIPFFCCCC